MTSSKHWYSYQGRSMWPGFQDGDLLEVVKNDSLNLNPGDCIVYRSTDGQKIIHRVVACRGKILTRGDALPHNDEQPISPQAIIGHVVRRHRFGSAATVPGGRLGLIMGWFYRFAGRIDPERDALGGRLARALQTITMPMLKPLWKRGQVRQIAQGDNVQLMVWKIGKYVVARKSTESGPWETSWPWKVLLNVGALKET